MNRILFVIPGLDFGGAARQLALLACGLAEGAFEPVVCVLGRDGPLGEPLRAAGIPVEVLGWTRQFDIKPFWRLRRLVRTLEPDVIHVWGRSALRATLPAAGAAGDRLVVSAPFPPQKGAAKISRVDVSLLRRVHRIAASGPAEAESCRRLGLPVEKVVIVTPGVGEASPANRTGSPENGIPRTEHLVVCVGPIEPHKGFRDAIWASDILRFLYEDLRLVVAGDGSDAGRLRRFVGAIGAHWVHFTGRREDILGLLARSDVVWIPSLAPGGVNVALEAMALGRPVVASRLPCLAEVVADGETGYLFGPGDKGGLARQTRLLLDDAGRRREFGEAARRRVAAHFAAADLVRRFGELYESVRRPVVRA